MRKLSIHPGAVCRQLLTNLKCHEALSDDDERKIIHAIESTMIPGAVDRVLANVSRKALEKLLKEI